MSVIRDIVLYGAGGAGKTNIVHRLSGFSFQPAYIASMGLLMSQCKIDDAVYRFYDTPGQLEGQYMHLIGDNKYIPVAVVVFDNSSYLSYRSAIKYIIRVRKVNPVIRIVLCCNKSDISRHRKIPDNSTIREKLGVYQVVEVSSKNNTGFDNLFSSLNQ